MDGSKKYEFRKIIPTNAPRDATFFIYESAPVMRITGMFTIEGISQQIQKRRPGMNVDMSENQILYVATSHFNKAENILRYSSASYKPYDAKKDAMDAIKELQEAIRLFDVVLTQKGDQA